MRRGLAFAALALGCGPEPKPPAEARPCVLGESHFCTCPDGSGRTAQCGPDGVFQSCPCGGDAEPSSPPSPRQDAAAPAPADASVILPPPEDASVLLPDVGGPDVTDPDAAPEAPDAGPLTCPSPPEVVVIRGGVQMFRYEASHPLATPAEAFPGAVSQGEGPRAPAGPTDACSRPGVRPWHSVTWGEATAACRRLGWRLCTADEQAAECSDGGTRDWTFGPVFDAAACNLREVYSAPGAGHTSEAPTGAYPRCVSPDGVYDLTGNLWEWTRAAPTYVAGGWRLIAERHREQDLVCAASVTVNEAFASQDVGFRCCL